MWVHLRLRKVLQTFIVKRTVKDINIPKDVQNILDEFDLKLLEYINAKNIIAIDQNSYKYKLNLSNLKTRHKLPHLFRRNPFVIENIKNYLKINNTGLELLSEDYIDCKHKLKFICSKHKDKGIQYRSLDDVINGKHYCKYCSIEKRGKLFHVSAEIVQKRCEALGLNYINKYIKNQETWVKFTCNKHLSKGIQEIAWYHLKTCSVGCAYCTGRYKSTADFIKELNDINPNIEVIGDYNGSEFPIKCKCKLCGHIWSPISRSLKNNEGCPNCCISKGELKVKQFLEHNQIDFIAQKTFEDCKYKSKLKFDFYVPQSKLAIEYDGEQHFKPVDFANKGHQWANNLFEQNTIKDNIKNDYCKKHNIKLLRIPYWNFDNIDNILASELSDAILYESL